MDWLRKAFAAMLITATFAFSGASHGQTQESAVLQDAVLVGPVNALFPPVGTAIRKPLAAPLAPEARWTIKTWIRLDLDPALPRTVVTMVGEKGGVLASLGVRDNQLVVQAGGRRLATPFKAKVGEWQLVTLTADAGKLALQVGTERAVQMQTRLSGSPVALVLGPREPSAPAFRGALASLTLWQGNSAAAERMTWSLPDPRLIVFENASPAWPLQVKQTMGLTVPQVSATLPVSRAAATAQPAVARPEQTPPLTVAGDARWIIGAWRLAAAPDISAAPAAIAQTSFGAEGWLPATVPGTILATYVANGVYPDPAYGLNNLLIPDSLSRQDYWLRTEFVVPDGGSRAGFALAFHGINYAGEIWVNGERLGTTEGAFTRGRFSLPASIKPGERVALAVRVSPPPHPGLPHEESLTAGPGLNGGEMTIDGPTFAASEGWDWIPTVRDRNTGVWQDVVLEVAGDVRLGDPHVNTVLPLADNSLAELTFSVPVTNESAAARKVEVEARFGDVTLRQTVTVPPGATAMLRFAPDQFAALRIRNPELWWPNGYGAPILHDLSLTARFDGTVSDTRAIRFGIREVSYELSLVDPAEELQRVAMSPARSLGEKLLDVGHKAIRKVEGGWAVSLAREIAGSPALAPVKDALLAPHLLIRVNGVPIAVRGGNWGMDDWMKRVARERMEPFFRLHREANVNTIRNWMGQSTESVFYDLADEYGLLVLNDFWISTQDHNGEPGDTALFLANAADTVSRFQHHPSIALWIGRNEGVPPPVMNRALDLLVREIDGTRAYLPNSREVNMAGSGPWNYQPPEAYFTRIGRGFSTEVGTPSFPTLETFKAMMPPEDQWPISDSWAYHDWHQGKAGDVASFMRAMANRLGEATGLEDFESKAQLLNYESHRAIFEGMNAGLFTRNSGRLLWMTHPAWPSTTWQIYSHDYDTHAAFYGTKKGSEPVHVQVNLPDRKLAVVNSLGAPVAAGRIRVRNLALDGTLLDDRTLPVDAPAHGVIEVGDAVPEAVFARAPVVITKLELLGRNGALLSENLYWLSREPADTRAMSAMQQASVSLTARRVAGEGEQVFEATLTNLGSVPALMVKLTARDAAGERVLPAYYDDNYVSLLPGETRMVTIRAPLSGAGPRSIGVRGWNVTAGDVQVTP
jgi:beta-galactosidase/beta-glucuronidase